jgi:hypothetical protein
MAFDRGCPTRYTTARKISRVFWGIHYLRPGWSSRTLDSAVRKFLAVAGGGGWCRATSDTSTMVPLTMGRISEPRVGWPSCHTESTSHTTAADKRRNRLGLGQKGPASRLAGYWSRPNWALVSPEGSGASALCCGTVTSAGSWAGSSTGGDGPRPQGSRGKYLASTKGHHFPLFVLVLLFPGVRLAGRSPKEARAGPLNLTAAPNRAKEEVAK